MPRGCPVPSASRPCLTGPRWCAPPAGMTGGIIGFLLAWDSTSAAARQGRRHPAACTLWSDCDAARAAPGVDGTDRGVGGGADRGHRARTAAADHVGGLAVRADRDVSGVARCYLDGLERGVGDGADRGDVGPPIVQDVGGLPVRGDRDRVRELPTWIALAGLPRVGKTRRSPDILGQRLALPPQVAQAAVLPLPCLAFRALFCLPHRPLRVLPPRLPNDVHGDVLVVRAS